MTEEHFEEWHDGYKLGLRVGKQQGREKALEEVEKEFLLIAVRDSYTERQFMKRLEALKKRGEKP